MPTDNCHMKQKHYPHWALAVLVGITIVAAIHTPPIKLPSPPATRTVILAGDHRDEAVQGAADATIVVVEYVSTTCAHCAAFHTKIWPQLREAYVASGKVRWIRRPWVSDTQAMAEWMLAICMPERGNDIRREQNAFADNTLHQHFTGTNFLRRQDEL